VRVSGRAVGESAGREASTQYAVLPAQRAPAQYSRDALIAAALALVTVATRLPFRSHRVFNWDAVNFVLALHDYDVRLHHPHPPGYPVFIAMGRVLQLVIPDANNALVAVAMLLSAGAVAAIYWLGCTLWNRAAGLVAALYLLCSVTFWTNGAVALAYPSLALFTTLAALFAWWSRVGQPTPLSGDLVIAHRPAPYAPLLLSAAYAIGAGFRPDLLLFLLPLWIFGHWRRPARQVVLSGALVVVIVLCWFVPTAALSGGWTEYWKVFRAYTSNDVLKRYSVAENGARALVVNIRDTVKYTGYALYALALPVAGAAIWLVVHWREGGRIAMRPYIWLFALWVTPMLLFYTWLHIGDPGYVFTFVPALLLLAARFTIAIPELLRRILATVPNSVRNGLVPLFVAAVVILNTGIFLFRPLTLTAHGIRQQDQTIDAKIAYVRAHGDPRTTLLISYESYRHWLLYLPEYRVQFVDVTYGTEQDRTVTPPPGTTTAILMDATLLRALTGATYRDEAATGNDHVASVPTTGTVPLRFNAVASPLGTPPQP
jgi:hypothetical protein